MSKAIVMDLDGTICEQTKGGAAYFAAKPIQSMIDKLQELRRNGFRIIIHTARGMKTFDGDLKIIEREYRKQTEYWLTKNEVPFDELHFGKPAGDYYVDDKILSIKDFLNLNE